MGERCVVPSGDTVCFTASFSSEKQKKYRILLRLYEDGKVLASSVGGALSVTLPARPGAYRIEAYQYTAQVGPLFLGVRPWVWSNPIYITNEK